MEPSLIPSTIYQFRVVVQGISPLIWRRLLIRSDMSLATLHATLQIIFAWSDAHLQAIVPLDPRHLYPVCTGGKRAAPPEDCGGAWAYMQLVDRHHVPLEAMAVITTALERLRKADDSTTMRQVIGDRDTFREAVDQLDAYLQFQPEHFDRHDINTQLRSLGSQEGEQPCNGPSRS